MTKRSIPKQDTLPPEPDAFQAVGVEASGWMVQHERTLILAVVAVVLVAGGAALASYMRDRGNTRAAQTLGQTLQVLERPVADEAQGAGAAEKPPFPTQKAKDEALRTELSAFIADKGDSTPGLTATLTRAGADYRLGDHAAAQSGFEAYLAKAPKESPLRLSALEGRGLSLEAQGKLDEALAAFGTLATEAKGEFLVGMGSYHRGRLLAAQGKSDEAVKVFQEVVTQHPNTAAARQATDRLQLLAAQGVAIPTPPAAAPAVDAG